MAAVHAALWARSDKQAALLLTMPVQQRLTTAERVGRALLAVRRDARRAFLHATVVDLLDGVRSISEAEFAAECRRRGLPKPTRQVVRKGRDGRYYLDVCWEEWGVVVEIDGIQHTWASNVVADHFFAQIEQALRDRGCPLAGTCGDPVTRTTAS